VEPKVSTCGYEEEEKGRKRKKKERRRVALWHRIRHRKWVHSQDELLEN